MWQAELVGRIVLILLCILFVVVSIEVSSLEVQLCQQLYILRLLRKSSIRGIVSMPPGEEGLIDGLSLHEKVPLCNAVPLGNC